MNKIIKKVLTIFSIVVISLFTLSVYGWMVAHIHKGDKEFGVLKQPIKFMYTFPDMFKQSVEEVKTLPKTYLKTPDYLKPYNLLKKDIVVIVTHPNSSGNKVIELLNLKNDSVFYEWEIDNPYGDWIRIKNPLLFPNKSLCYGFDTKGGIVRIDSLGNKIWQQDTIRLHHSLTLDSDSNIWACTYSPYLPNQSGFLTLGGQKVLYEDNYIAKLNSETGEIMFLKSVTQIMKDNDLESYLLKSFLSDDLIHLNDIQPALKTTKYYEKDDLFLSLRNFSAIVHYRPSTNKVIEVIEGPFATQHDVDFYNDSTLAFFNNNAFGVWAEFVKEIPNKSSHVYAGDFYSNIIHYHLNTGEFSTHCEWVFKSNKIYSRNEGLIEYLDTNTVFVEEQNSGLLWVIQNNEAIYLNVLDSEEEGYHYLPNWTRIIRYGDDD